MNIHPKVAFQGIVTESRMVAIHKVKLNLQLGTVSHSPGIGLVIDDGVRIGDGREVVNSLAIDHELDLKRMR